MTRRVFSTIDETCHKWAHQSVDRGRNSTGSVYFEGRTIYSYGDHFPVAVLHPDKGAALFNPDTYSTSTSRHQSAARSAAGHLECFAVPNLEPRNDAENLENWRHLRGVMLERVNELTRARDPSKYQLQACDAAAERVNSYRRLFWVRGLEPRLQNIAPLPLDEREAIERRIDSAVHQARERAERAEADRIAAEAAAAALRARQELCERLTFGLYRAPRPAAQWYDHNQTNMADDLPAKIAKWRAGEGRLPYGYTGDVMLRIESDGETVRTSKNALFSVDDARRFWPMIERARETGQRIDTPLVKMGGYQVNYVDSNGDVKASCHYIKYAELRRLAIALKLARPTLLERFGIAA